MRHRKSWCIAPEASDVDWTSVVVIVPQVSWSALDGVEIDGHGHEDGIETRFYDGSLIPLSVRPRGLVVGAEIFT